jgi:hypothetical protein
MTQSREGSNQSVLAVDDVSNTRRLYERAILLAILCHSAHLFDAVRKADMLSTRTFQPECRHTNHHDPRVERSHSLVASLVAKPEAVHYPRREILGHNICARDQLLEDLASFFG